ncbi:unnamed protein product [Owenia fusiformis]|uniref:Uncharacterized protein n=1 Tax=Owenia fusiformis TaxID=6347 RepID=A0A8J1T8Y7_OWEFU|nr:unnamed protein product [Owenia fusiformis]
MAERKQHVNYGGIPEDAMRFMLAGISMMTAGGVTNPIDVIKIRMQLDNELSGHKKKNVFHNRYYKGFVRGTFTIVREEGPRGLMKGVFPSVLREGIYSTIRLGAYEPIKRMFGATDPAHTPLWKKICAGGISGAIGSSIATPTDLVKVRLQAEGNLPQGQTPRYTGTFDAFRQIIKYEGIRGLYVGVGPTVQRAAILTATQIPAYDHIKHSILNHELMSEGTQLHFITSFMAGFVTACTTSPVDVIKTRIMNQKGKAKYSSTVHCLIKTIQAEGPLGLYKGFIPNWMRIGPHTVVSFLIFEQLRKLVGMDPV